MLALRLAPHATSRGRNGRAPLRHARPIDELAATLGRLVGAGLVAAPLLHAQGKVWVVDDVAGPGIDFTSLQAAIDATADGDTVLVRGGTYASQTVFSPLLISQRSIAVIADAGADVTLSSGIRVDGLVASQGVLLRGLTVWPASLMQGLLVTGCAGPVWVEDCVLHGGGNYPGAHVETSAGAALMRCEMYGHPLLDTEGTSASYGEALRVASSTYVYGSSATGANAPTSLITFTVPKTLPGGTAVQVNGGTLYASGSSFAGGKGYKGNATTSLSGFLCVPGSTGGAGLRISDVPTAGASAVLLDTACQGGPGGDAYDAQLGCGVGQVGAGIVGGGLTQLQGASHGLAITSPVREQQLIRAALRGTPGELAYIALAANATPATLLLPLSGALLISPASTVLALGVVPASGVLQVSQVAGPLPIGTEAALVWSESAFINPVGVVVMLGAPSTLTLVSASL